MESLFQQIQRMPLSERSLSIIGLIILFFLVAWIVQRLSGRLAQFILGVNRISSAKRKWRQERLDTLRGLIRSTIVFVAYTITLVFTLALFVNIDTLVWMIGLFSAAFGLGARPLISDYLTGIGFIFEDSMESPLQKGHFGRKLQFWVTI